MKKLILSGSFCCFLQLLSAQSASAKNAAAQENTIPSPTATISTDSNLRSQTSSVHTGTAAAQTTGDLKYYKKKKQPDNTNTESPE
jgi:hypothetical protein